MINKDEVVLKEKEFDELIMAKVKLNIIKKKIQLIQTYTDDERILAECNLILKEINDKTKFKEIPFFEGTMDQLEKLTIIKGEADE